MAVSVLYICPICGSNNILPVTDFSREEPLFVECLDCGNEVIPLATPQVCIHSTEDSYKEASLYREARCR